MSMSLDVALTALAKALTSFLLDENSRRQERHEHNEKVVRNSSVEQMR